MTPGSTPELRPARPAPAVRTVDDLVDAFRRGRDRDDSFRQLVERFHRPVESFLARRVTAPEDRRDLVQETFLRAYQALDGFRGDCRFGTWLFQIAHNTHAAWAGCQARRRETSLDGTPDPDRPEPWEPEDHRSAFGSGPTAPDARTLDRERQRLLRRALEDLPERMRQCMVLRLVHGLRYKEIAATLKLSIGTVKAHLFQGRQRLHEALEPRRGEPERGADDG